MATANVISMPLEEKVNMILSTVVKTEIDISAIKTNLEMIKNENIQLKQKISEMENKMHYLESLCNQNTMVFYNVPETTVENNIQCEEKIIYAINSNMNVAVEKKDIERTYRLGKKNNRNRPILVKFVNYKTKSEVSKNRSKLRGSGLAITDYFTSKVLEERKELMVYFNMEKEKNKNVYLKYNKLCIDDVEYTLDDLKNNKKGKQLKKIKEKQTSAGNIEEDNIPSGSQYTLRNKNKSQK